MRLVSDLLSPFHSRNRPDRPAGNNRTYLSGVTLRQSGLYRLGDGYYYCKPDGKKTEAGVVSVKGGETLHVDMVRDLRGVMEREKAPFAVLITLREPTAPMVKEAASAKFLDTSFGKFQRIQIITVANLLDGYLPKLPPQDHKRRAAASRSLLPRRAATSIS